MTKEQLIKLFEDHTTSMVETMKKKNKDYSGADIDPFHNFKAVERAGVATTEQGFYTRMTDKMMRLASFIKNGTLAVEDEKVADTLLDLANYSVLFACYLHDKNAKIATDTLVKED